jgi:hypothetical protein
MSKEGPSVQQAQQPEPNYFEFGDVHFECNRCGNYQLIDKGVKDGMQFVLPTSDQHEWRLVCGNCQNMMRIFFKESDEETVAAAKAKIAEEERKKAEEEAKQKAIKEAEEKEKDEPKKKNKKKRSSKRNSEDTSGSSQSDGKGDSASTSTD